MSWLTVGKSFPSFISCTVDEGLTPSSGDNPQQIADNTGASRIELVTMRSANFLCDDNEFEGKEKSSKHKRKREIEDRSVQRSDNGLSISFPSKNTADGSYVIDTNRNQSIAYEAWEQPLYAYSLASKADTKQYFHNDPDSNSCLKRLRYFGRSAISSFSFDYRRIRIPRLLAYKRAKAPALGRMTAEYQPLPPAIGNDNYIDADTPDSFVSDYQVNESELHQRRKYFNVQTRENPDAPGAWLVLVAAQNHLSALQGDVHTVQAYLNRTRRHCFCDWDNRAIIAKQLAIIEDAWRSSEACKASTALRLLYLRLQSVALPPDELRAQWDAAVEQHSLDMELCLEYARYTVHYRGGGDVEALLNRMQNAKAAELLNLRLFAGSSSVESRRRQLQMDEAMETFRIDLFVVLLSTDVDSGNSERAVAALQAMLHVNLGRGTLADLEATWDTDTPRFGDRSSGRDSMASAYSQLASRGADVLMGSVYSVDFDSIHVLSEVREAMLRRLRLQLPEDVPRECSVPAVENVAPSLPAAQLQSDRFGREERADGTYVYSRIHGYKIKIDESADTSLPYKKVLGELSDFSNPSIDLSKMTAEEILKLYVKPSVKEEEPLPVSPLDRYSIQGMLHKELSQMQWQPLRALSPALAKHCLEQPERVVFLDDIQKYIFRLEHYSVDHFLLCILRCFGVWVTDHSDGAPIETYLGEDIYSALLCPMPTMSNADSTCLSILSVTEDVARCDSALLDHHKRCAANNCDSRLSFCIRLLAQMVEAPGLSPPSVMRIRCILISVLSQAALVELSVARSGDILASFRSICRSIVTDAVPCATGNIPILNSNPQVSIVAGFDMSVWCVYILAECRLGQTAEARKLSVKAIAACIHDVSAEVAKYPSTTDSIFQVLAGVPGCWKLLYLGLKHILGVGVTEREAPIAADIKEALSLVIHFVKGRPLNTKKKAAPESINAMELMETERSLRSRLDSTLAPLVASLDPGSGGEGEPVVYTASVLAWCKFLSSASSLLSNGNDGADSREQMYAESIAAADNVFVAAIESLSSSLIGGGPMLPLSTFSAVNSNAPVRNKLRCVEALHERRLEFLLACRHWAYSLSRLLQLPITCAVPLVKSTLTQALQWSLNDFPKNASLLRVLLDMSKTSVRGMLRVKAYLRSLHGRPLWGGGLTVAERLFELQTELRFILLQMDLCTAPGREGRGIRDGLCVERWRQEWFMRLVRFIEAQLEDPRCCEMAPLWILYIQLLLRRGLFINAKKVFIRAIQWCPRHAEVWALAVGELRRAFTEEELGTITLKIEEHCILLRT